METSPCSHRPRTTSHLSSAWCSACSHWLLNYSQSGRRDAGGGVVLIEHLRNAALPLEGHGPDELALWAQRWLMSTIELENDRIDTDALRPAWRLRSV